MGTSLYIAALGRNYMIISDSEICGGEVMLKGIYRINNNQKRAAQ